MRKALFVILALIMVLGLSTQAFARDIEEVGETIWETARGKGSAPSLISEYVAKTWEDVEVPIVGKTDVRVKFEYVHSIRSLVDNNSVQTSVGLEF